MWFVVAASYACTGLDEVRIERGKDWVCNPVTEHVHLQRPPLCSETNRFVPRVFEVKNQTIGLDRHRLSIVPTFSYDDDGVLKYEFAINTLTCLPELSVVIDIINRNTRTEQQVDQEFLFAVLLCVFFLCICVCSCFVDASSDVVFFPSASSKAHFE